MKTADIRSLFLNYFKEHGHSIVPSSALVPTNDSTLLFTNAGMVQFKETFLGQEVRDYTRATSSQRCVRAGGKHNDLENVGYTARHHTFFEMLGNFSFGDYFKREAIKHAWEFLTVKLALPAEKLWVTVFEEDDETADIWLNEMNIDPSRFSRCGEKDNFWSMGDTGPCGPCSEIFYDHGPDIPGGPPGTPEEDGDRYIEIWNLVFMQYNRSSDGKIKPLPKPSVDTGMGLERIAAVMQQVHNNYDIDLFQTIIQAAAKLAKIKDLSNTSLRVIADHIRSSAFLIIDGVIPSNEGRGYVLRRIIRRALRHGHKLHLDNPFFYKLIQPLCVAMGEAYPELVKSQSMLEQTIMREEEAFASTLGQGMKIFEEEVAAIDSDVIPGEVVFKLYDTYGFPMDLTRDIAREKSLTIDEEGFSTCMAQQRSRSQAASKFGVDYNDTLIIDHKSDFTGYEYLQHDASVVSIIKDGDIVERLQAGESGSIILNKTPFYAEAGGQVGDRGTLTAAGVRFDVTDTQKQKDAICHQGKLTEGKLSVGDQLDATVYPQFRQQTAYNHSATHLLHAALREILGEHILQKGSLVEPERLRFDFSHFAALSQAQINALEILVNTKIRANLKVTTKIMTPEQAMDSGAMALFGEKYGKEVRVLSMGEFSMELCGGTHVAHTGDIGLFKIISESGIAAGIRRIEAVTGEHALVWVQQQEQQLQTAANLLKTNKQEIIAKIEGVVAGHKSLEKTISNMKQQMASDIGGDLAAKAVDIHDIKVLAVELENIDPKSLRDTLDKLKDKLPKAVILLATVVAGKITLVAGVTKNITDRYKAGELMQFVASQVGGKGGGRPDMAQGGGTEPDKLTAALISVHEWVKGKN